MATEHRTDLIPDPPMQTMVYPYTISQVLRFQHGRIAQMARGAE